MPKRTMPVQTPRRAVSRPERAAVAALLMGAAVVAADTGNGPAAAQGLVNTADRGSTPLASQIDPAIRAEASASLRAMRPDDLWLTYARLHAAFRASLDEIDLRPARAMIDYAALAEIELERRGLPRPPDTESAAEMLTLLELVL